MRDEVLRFALRDPPGSPSRSCRGLSPVLRGMRAEGLTELTEDPTGEILEVRLTDPGKREMASAASDR